MKRSTDQHAFVEESGQNGVGRNTTLTWVGWAVPGLLVLGGLLVVSRLNFLLFHGITELLSITVAWALFLLVWNARRWIRNDSLLSLGTAYLFIGFVALLHTLAYSGMGVFSADWGANLSTQLWIVSRYMETAALLSFTLLLGRRVRPWLSMGGWVVTTTVLLLAIFAWRIFPVCYREGQGLTAFKKASEYVICLVLLATLVMLHRKRGALDTVVYRLMAASILVSIAAEMAFTFYVSVYGLSNVVGHILKIISYALIYAALIHTGIRRPFALLSGTLNREQRDLRQREHLLQRVFDTLPIGLWFADKSGKLLRGNPAGIKIWGAEPLVDPSKYGVFKARRLPSGEEVNAEDWALIRTVREKATILDELLEIEAFDGQRKIILNSTAPVLDDHGELQGAIIINRDITQQKQDETYREMHREVLQVLNAPGELHSVIERVLDLLKTRIGVDAVGMRLQDGTDYPYYAQRGFSSDFVQAENSLLERSANGDVCRDKDGNPCLECTCGLILSGKTDPENPLFTRAGSAWTNDSFPMLEVPDDQAPRHRPRNRCIHDGYASVALIPIRDKQRIVGLLQFNDHRKGRFTLALVEKIEDIAAYIGEALMRKRAEEDLRRAKDEAQEANRAKSEFLANMSHELRTPLNPILGFTELMETAPNLTEEQRCWLGIVRQRGQDLRDLIAAVLDFSKIEAQRIVLQPGPMALRRTVREMMDSIKPLTDQKGLRIEWEVTPDLPEDLVADGLRLRQIVLNLLNNAIKFTSAGGISLRVQDGRDARLGRPPREGETALLFRIQDTGIGIPPDRQAIIFESFAQADPAHAVDYGGGAGLGLAIASRLTQCMDGIMWLESTPGEGSTFFFTMLVARDKRPPAEEARDPVSSAPGRSLHVLIVEDDPSSLTLAETAMRRTGHTFRSAKNGAEALALAKVELFDAVLMDIEMPIMNGLEATRMIRDPQSGDPDRQMPIIAMTANALSGDRERCLAAGMDDYIAKPLTLQALNAILNKYSKQPGIKRSRNTASRYGEDGRCDQ